MAWFPNTTEEERAREAASPKVAPAKEWTAEEDAQVLAMLADGMTRKAIAERMGVTRNAICGKVHRLSRRAAKTAQSEPAPSEPEFDLHAYWEDCYWPADRMKMVVAETLGYPEFPMEKRIARAGLFLFGCVLVGRPYAPWVAMVTGLDRRECCWFGIRARRAKIIQHRKIDSDPWEKGEPLAATIEFVMDCMVIAEELAYKGERGPDRLYYAVPETHREHAAQMYEGLAKIAAE